MSYLKINGTDVSYLVKGLKVGYETLVSEDSGRNAAGDTVLDIINKKVKLYVTFRPMDSTDMAKLLTLIDGYVVDVTYRDSKMNTLETINCYTGTPNAEYYWVHNDHVFYKQMQLNFIEL
jgi:5'-3' exonuclease